MISWDDVRIDRFRCRPFRIRLVHVPTGVSIFRQAQSMAVSWADHRDTLFGELDKLVARHHRVSRAKEARNIPWTDIRVDTYYRYGTDYPIDLRLTHVPLGFVVSGVGGSEHKLKDKLYKELQEMVYQHLSQDSEGTT